MDSARAIQEDREPARPRGRALLIMAVATLGVVVGDISTSPIYALNGLFNQERSAEDDVVGAVSTIFYALLLVAVVKYSLIALEFGSREGEGGPPSLLTSLYAASPDDEEENTMLANRKIGLAAFRTTTFDAPPEELSPAMRRIRALANESVKWALLTLSLLGTAFTIADGLLTPAVSITSAVEGLSLVTSLEIGKSTMGISIAVLFVIFSAQRFGTAAFSRAYSPIVVAWLLWLGGTGIAMIVEYPGIWRALNPCAE